jgi:hypothetical protein
MDRPPPFLSKSDQSNLQETEEWPEHPTYQRNQVFDAQQKPQSFFDGLKDNPMALVLIGIILGAILVNMRPLVIKQ